MRGRGVRDCVVDGEAMSCCAGGWDERIWRSEKASGRMTKALMRQGMDVMKASRPRRLIEAMVYELISSVTLLRCDAILSRQCYRMH